MQLTHVIHASKPYVTWLLAWTVPWVDPKNPKRLTWTCWQQETRIYLSSFLSILPSTMPRGWAPFKPCLPERCLQIDAWILPTHILYIMLYGHETVQIIDGPSHHSSNVMTPISFSSHKLANKHFDQTLYSHRVAMDQARSVHPSILCQEQNLFPNSSAVHASFSSA